MSKNNLNKWEKQNIQDTNLQDKINSKFSFKLEDNNSSIHSDGERKIEESFLSELNLLNNQTYDFGKMEDQDDQSMSYLKLPNSINQVFSNFPKFLPFNKEDEIIKNLHNAYTDNIKTKAISSQNQMEINSLLDKKNSLMNAIDEIFLCENFDCNIVMICKIYISMFFKKLHSFLDNIDSTTTILSFQEFQKNQDKFFDLFILIDLSKDINLKIKTIKELNNKAKVVIQDSLQRTQQKILKRNRLNFFLQRMLVKQAQYCTNVTMKENNDVIFIKKYCAEQIGFYLQNLEKYNPQLDEQSCYVLKNRIINFVIYKYSERLSKIIFSNFIPFDDFDKDENFYQNFLILSYLLVENEQFYTFDQIANTMIQKFKKYSDDIKENISEKNNKKQIFTVYQKYTENSIKAFENLRDIYYLVFNFFYQKGTIDKLPSCYTFLQNFIILQNNTLIEFILHIKEFVEKTKVRLFNRQFYVNFDYFLQFIQQKMLQILDEKFQPQSYFLKLNKTDKKQYRNIFNDFKSKLNLNLFKSFIQKVKILVLKKVQKNMYTEYQQIFSSLYLKTHKIFCNSLQYKGFLQNLKIEQNKVEQIYDFSDYFLLSIRYINDFICTIQYDESQKNQIEQYVLLIIQGQIKRYQNETENKLETNQLCLICSELEIYQTILEKLIIKQILTQFEKYKIIQQSLQDAFECFSQQIVEDYQKITQLILQRYIEELQKLIEQGNIDSPSIHLQDALYKIIRQDQYMDKYRFFKIYEIWKKFQTQCIQQFKQQVDVLMKGNIRFNLEIRNEISMIEQLLIKTGHSLVN